MVSTLLNRNNLSTRSFKSILKRASLPHRRFHDLRHTCATLLLGKGVHLKFVQELLGHTTIAITLAIPTLMFFKTWETKQPQL
ncbi:MAG TPA: tyrosine-type recombinase/integrase [Rubrobacteraceae bacterium]|nr:tyrosine-type recombinase/integrase [Rubrobacteraceae bacterium]